ncbi:hypothetical protein [Tenacibaculum mesophilum]|uniref:hypothetical protein n=1 Tax=Tenacibaculum mesophilum TaxID=104268 RepID=UPI003F5F4646
MITLCTFNPDDDYDLNFPESMTSLKDYVLDKPLWNMAPEDTLIIFDALSEEQNMQINKFGLLDFLIPQLEQVFIQLKEGKDTLLRTAGDYGATFFLFEPKGSMVYFSILGSFPNELNSYYPLLDSPLYTSEAVNQYEKLYDYLADYKAVLKENPNKSFLANTITNISMPLGKLLTEIENQIYWAKETMKKIYNQT